MSRKSARGRRQVLNLRHPPQGLDHLYQSLSLPDLGRDIRLAVEVFATAVRVFRTEVYVMPAGVGATRISIAVPEPRSGRLAPRLGWRGPWPGSVLIRPEIGGAHGGTCRPRAAGPTAGAARAARGRKEGQEAVADRPPGMSVVKELPAPSRAELWLGRGTSWSLRRSRPERWVEADVSALDVSPGGSVEEVSGRASDRALQLFDNRCTTYLPPEPATASSGSAICSSSGTGSYSFNPRPRWLCRSPPLGSRTPRARSRAA